MNAVNDQNTYGWVQVTLHWLTVLFVFSLFGLGLWMEGLDYYDAWYREAPALHKSLGFVLILMLIFRLFWRFHRGLPSPLPNHKTWERNLASLVHFFFYIALFSMFFSGYFITTAKGQALEVLGFIAIPATITGIESFEHFAHEVHELSAFTIMGVVALHALGAFKHHFIDKDRTFLRILGR